MADLRNLSVDETSAGKRLDAYLADVLEDLTRSRIKALIEQGNITLDGARPKASSKISAGQVICVEIPDPVPVTIEPQAMDLEVLFEDENIIVINKPAGLVVHPAAGNPDGTLVNALAAHCDDLSGIGGELRPGIVHRLDKGTSGVMVAAKNDIAHNDLTRQFAERIVKKQYRAVTIGVPKPGRGTWDDPIGRHPTERKKMSIYSTIGKPAVTHYRVLAAYEGVAALGLKIESGRTHQIRVHCSAAGYPVANDDLYGGQKRIREIQDIELAGMLKKLTRPALHAFSLALDHPIDGKRMEFHAPLPADIAEIFSYLGAPDEV